MPALRFFDCDVMLGRTLVPGPLAIPDARRLLQEMDACGINACLFFSYAASFGPEASDRMNELTRKAARESGRLVPCASLRTSPFSVRENLADQVERIVDGGFRAARIVSEEGPAGIPVSLRLFELEELFGRMAERRLPLLVPCEHLPGQDAMLAYGFEQIDSVARANPELPIILLRPRYSAQAPVLALLRRHKNIRVSMTLLTLFRQVESFAAEAGTGRILFGSHLPYRDPSVPQGSLLYSKLGNAERSSIAGGALEALLEGVR
jgi:predicted TIM-barrel fold metal-dependent hydrolase